MVLLWVGMIVKPLFQIEITDSLSKTKYCNCCGMKNYSGFIKETLIKFYKCELKTWKKYFDINPKP